MSSKARRNVVFGVLVIVSIIGLFFSPISETTRDLRENLPWVGVGLVVSESLFTIGLLIIAASVGMKLNGWPWEWRSQLMPAIRKQAKGVLFWVGFGLNLIGALGSGVVVGVGIILTFPWQSWGLLVLPFSDLVLTVAVRAAALGIIEDDDVPPA